MHDEIVAACCCIGFWPNNKCHPEDTLRRVEQGTSNLLQMPFVGFRNAVSLNAVRLSSCFTQGKERHFKQAAGAVSDFGDMAGLDIAQEELLEQLA